MTDDSQNPHRPHSDAAAPPSARPLACLILAAGKGTRMKSDRPKVLHPIAGRPMLSHVIAACEALSPGALAVVVGPGMEDVAAAAAPWPTAVQAEQNGTGGAVLAGLPAIANRADGGFDGDVLVVFGDTPLVTAETLCALVDRRGGADDPAVVALGMEPRDPGRYGRLVLNATGGLERIVEYLDATPTEREIGLCNGGLMAFDGRRLPALLAGLSADNAKGELYQTDTVAIARAKGWACAHATGPETEALGVNSRAQLADAERQMQDRLRARWLDDGVTMTAPETVFLAADTVFGRDVSIGPYCQFGPGVTVGGGADILAFSHLEGATVAAGARIGPYARLRPGAAIGEAAHIGNFVEVKAAEFGAGAKANHLSYIGDASIGAGANIGAGTITCNYDGFFKHKTVVGAGAFIGSNSALVAPVEIGDGATVAAGSTITRAVPGDALALARGRQEIKPGWAAKFRQRMAAAKTRAKAALSGR